MASGILSSPTPRPVSPATLDSWSLNITPQVKVSPVASTVTTVNGVAVGHRVCDQLPAAAGQRHLHDPAWPGHSRPVSATVRIPTSSAGLNVLRDEGQNGPTTTMQYSALNLPMPIPAATTGTSGQSVLGTVSSSISVPDSFIIEGDQTAAGLSVMQVELDASFANDSDLTATLYPLRPRTEDRWARSRCSVAWALVRMRPISPTRSSTTTRAHRFRRGVRRSPRSTIRRSLWPRSSLRQRRPARHERPGNLDADDHEQRDRDDGHLTAGR